MKKRAIVIICHFAGTPENGMNYRPYHFAKHFLKHGYHPIVVGCGYHHQMRVPKNISNSTKTEVIEGIKYIWMPSRRYNPESDFARLLNMLGFMIRLYLFNLKRVIESHELISVIASSPSLFSAVNAYRFAKKYSASFIFEVRDMWPLSVIELKNLSTRHPFVRFLQFFETYAYKRADKVVSVLPAAEEYMLQHGLEHGKFVNIPNGIDTELIENYTRTSTVIKGIIPENKFVIGYAGSIGLINSMECFIEAAKLLEDNKKIHFVIVGDGPEKNSIVEMAKHCSNVSILPIFPKKNVYTVIELFNVCFLSWRKKELYKLGVSANKIFDYMFMGKPILQALSYGNDLISEAECGITVEAENSKAIAEGVLKLFHLSESELEILGKNGQKFVHNNHSFDVLIKKYLEIIDQSDRT